MTIKTTRIVTLLFLGILLATTSPAALTIDAIRIENRDKVELDSSFVRAYTSMRAGQSLETELELNDTVALDVDSLRRSGRFSYVRSFIEQDEGKVTLVYTVVPRLRLRQIEINGADGIGNRKVKKSAGA